MKRALLIIGGILAVLASVWFFFFKGKGSKNPSSNNSGKEDDGITLADFDPTAKSAKYGQAVADIGGRLLNKWF